MTEAPVTRAMDAAYCDSETVHPAFGQIGASRVVDGACLYGSDFQHRAYVVVRIKRSRLLRGLSHDWHNAGEELIEVALSEAQWAAFVAASNAGDGVPCTLRRVAGVDVPGLSPSDRASQFKQEADARLAAGLERLNELLRLIDELGVPKGKSQQLRSGIEAVGRELTSNVPFVARSFSRHLEQAVEKAKAEVHGYVTTALHGAGLARPPLATEEKP